MCVKVMEQCLGEFGSQWLPLLRMVVVFPTLSLKGDPHLLHSPADTERMHARLLS